MKSLAARMTQLMASKKQIDADEIAQAARELIRNHPSDAIIRAEARYDFLLARGRVDDALRWWRIKEAVSQLRDIPLYD